MMRKPTQDEEMEELQKFIACMLPALSNEHIMMALQFINYFYFFAIGYGIDDDTTGETRQCVYSSTAKESALE